MSLLSDLKKLKYNHPLMSWLQNIMFDFIYNDETLNCPLQQISQFSMAQSKQMCLFILPGTFKMCKMHHFTVLSRSSQICQKQQNLSQGSQSKISTIDTWINILKTWPLFGCDQSKFDVEWQITQQRTSVQPSMVMHWNTVSMANKKLSKLVMPLLGPCQPSLQTVSLIRQWRPCPDTAHGLGSSSARAPGGTVCDHFIC